MRYFKELNDDGRLIAIGSGDIMNGVEISKEEYDQLMEQRRQQNMFAAKIYHHEIGMEDVPEAWRVEVAERVDGLLRRQGIYDPNKISGNEALDIIMGVVTQL